MRIRIESTDEQPFVYGADMMLVGPFAVPLTTEQEREAAVTLFGSLLDGGYDFGPE